MSLSPDTLRQRPNATSSPVNATENGSRSRSTSPRVTTKRLPTDEPNEEEHGASGESSEGSIDETDGAREDLYRVGHRDSPVHGRRPLHRTTTRAHRSPVVDQLSSELHDVSLQSSFVEDDIVSSLCRDGVLDGSGRGRRNRNIDSSANDDLNYSSSLSDFSAGCWTSGQWFAFAIVFFFLLAFIAWQTLYVMVLYPGGGIVPFGGDETWQRLSVALSNVHDEFPHQPAHTWRLIKAALRPQLLPPSGGPLHPAVILLAGNASSQAMPCLARKLARVLAERSGWAIPDCVEMNVNTWRGGLPGTVKLLMDEQTQRSYNTGARCILLTQLELVPAEGAKMLHALCDGENAPYKDIVLLITLQMDPKNALPWLEKPTGKSYTDAMLDSLVENRLQDMWEKELGSEEMQAVLSRMANSVVVVREEDQITLERSCFS